MSTFQLRPLGFGGTLDAAFTIYRRWFLTLFLTALLPSVPVIAYWLLIASLVGTGAETTVLGLADLVLVYQLIASPVAWAASIYLIGRAVRSESLSIGAAYRHALRRIPAFGAGLLLSAVIIGLGSVLVIVPASLLALAAGLLSSAVIIGLGSVLPIVPASLLAIMCFAVLAVIVIEGKGPIAAIGRSRQLARGAYARIAGVYIVATLITMLPLGLVWTGQGFIGAFQPAAEAGIAAAGPMYAISQALIYVVSSLTGPFSNAVLVLLYFDRRIRVEGFGLEMPDQPLAGEATPVSH